jgi:hypothetical protein
MREACESSDHSRYERVLEHTLLEAPGVTVTTSRLILAAESYAVSDIANYAPQVKRARRQFAILAVFTAFALLVVGRAVPNMLALASACALCLGWWGALALLLATPEHRIVVNLRSGKAVTISRRRPSDAAEIADALSLALRVQESGELRRRPVVRQAKAARVASAS